jgi:hypothetical protein
VDCEKWRQDFNLDELVRNFEYTEKAEVFQYYPQYYHKTDKVGKLCRRLLSIHADKELGWTARIHRAAGQYRSASDV